MGKNIIWDNIDWTEGDDFLAFAFGDFVSSNAGIIRTSDGDRYNINLVPPMQDKTADVPGGDGQYYFGTTHKPKIFSISFAFDDLTKEQLRTIKQTFAGKEMREFCLSEESDKIYMVKVTSQPSLKALCFFDGDDERYRGEGSVQFTAYWPYGRNVEESVLSTKTTTAAEGVEVLTKTLILNNDGDISAHFTFSAEAGAQVSKLQFNSNNNIVTIEGIDIASWDSKTGIVKNSAGDMISYTGDGLYKIPIGSTTVIITYKPILNKTLTLKYYNWYY